MYCSVEETSEKGLTGRVRCVCDHRVIRDDVPAEILRAEILVIATPQPAANSDAGSPANPRDVAIGKRDGNDVSDVLLPLRVRSATSEERRLYDLKFVARSDRCIVLTRCTRATLRHAQFQLRCSSRF